MTTLSQDEINAMLNGLDNANTEASEVAEAAQAEVASGSAAHESTFFTENAAMLAHEPLPEGAFDVNAPEWQLTNEEIDVLGEVGNICMGAVATTMYTLLDRRTDITTPRVSVHTTQEVLSQYSTPFVVVEVEYIEGIDGKNLLLLKEKDAAMITDLLMGGDGQVEEPVELNELHMSAISEIMNQMIGASATAMAKVLGMPVNISPPQSVRVDQNEDVGQYLDQSQVVVKISFDMEIEGLLKSQLLQMIPFSLSRNLVKKVTEVGGGGTAHQAEAAEAAPAPAPAPAAAPAAEAVAPAPAPQAAAPAPVEAAAPQIPPQAAYPPPQGYPYPYPYPPYDPAMAAAAAAYAQPPAPQPGNLVDVRPMQYQPFDARPAGPTASAQGMELVHDIPLTVTVELGRTKKDISEILEFGLGSVIVLDKVAGDPVEILVNGKLIARGEVVVIDENYGVRITDILNG